MESIHATYRHSIHPVPSEQYWSSTNYLKIEAPIIKRPIGRPKVYNRRRDPVKDLINGPKLKRTFKVTCTKCGEKGHNYKTCKGAPANPNWKPKTRRPRNAGSGSTTPHVEVPLSESAPQTQEEENQVEPSQAASQAPTTTSHAHLPFRPPAQVRQTAATSRLFRAKQPVQRQVKANSLPPSEVPTPSQAEELSKETLAVASASTQRKFKFMQRINKQH
ncbi:hypothetical protein PIB30_074423 [Stylosanthes scabra]|uniref:CCHC-type domain-containing protein n=1 Tax=Stylosanthes scabra TaxID=79078 RepID=A0ABU6YQ05_9FABA|nr:hypothetical protein [Stylosanthes scabra]